MIPFAIDSPRHHEFPHMRESAERYWKERDVFQKLWPGFDDYLVRHNGLLPPLDDYEIDAEIACGFLPSWMADKFWTINRAGGCAHVERMPLRAKVGGEMVSVTKDRKVVMKPRRNPHGLSLGVRVDTVLYGEEVAVENGWLAQPLYEGEHVSADIAYVDGMAAWGVASLGIPAGFGEFTAWHCPWRVHPMFVPKMRWLIPKFTGVLNVETIGGKLIEVHFRPSLEFFRLYGPKLSEAIVEAAAGRVCDDMPAPTGGVMLVQGKDRPKLHEAFIDVEKDLHEDGSWRQALVYVTNGKGQ